MHRPALLFVLALFCLSDGRSSISPPLADHEFGFSLNPTAQGEQYALFVYTVYNGEVVGSMPLSTNSFILQTAGLQESRANMGGVDLFADHDIANCGAWIDQRSVRTSFECPSIQQLWKLRYRKEMVKGQGEGWAMEELTPSVRQQVLLGLYRPAKFVDWHGPYFGDKAFQLLHDMQDPEWVRLYQEGG